MVNYILLLFKILGTSSWLQALPYGFLWPIIYEKPDMPLPNRSFKSHCVILLHSSFPFTIQLAMFQVEAVPSAWVPEWRHQTELQLTNGRGVKRPGNKPLLFQASEIWGLFCYGRRASADENKDYFTIISEFLIH